MTSQKNKNSTKYFVIITFIIMVAVNGMANALPINGLNTGQVSDSYPNLFAPAGVTFAIWGLIYLLLAIYAMYQAGLFQGKDKAIKTQLMEKIGVIFSISSLANAAWIFSWHYQIIPLSIALMLVILLSLIMINNLIDKESLSSKEKFFIRLPFSVYFGWITVATIANITIFLVDFSWNGFGVSESMWTIIILLVGMAIGVATMLRTKNAAYGFVLIWAYFGIWIKHTSQTGFASQYSEVIITILICIALFMVSEAYLFFEKREKLDA